MRRAGQETPAEAEAPRTETKEFMTKAEYNRWLIKQENAKLADERRQAAKAEEEFVKERQRSHTARGLSRQQAAMVQMKRASESLEAHRQQNLSHGRKVHEEVTTWREAADAAKKEYAAHRKSIKEEQKKNNGAGESMKQNEELKKSQAAVTRAEDQAKAATREQLKQQRAAEVREAAEQVRKAVGDEATDAAKRLFFEQRLQSAKDTKANSAMFEKRAPHIRRRTAPLRTAPLSMSHPQSASRSRPRA